MLNEDTRRKLRELNLSELIEAFDIQDNDPSYMSFSLDERLMMAVDYIYQKKFNSKVQRLIKLSKFRITNATIQAIHYADRGIDRQLMMELSTCQFIDTSTSLIFHGFTGSGKSYLACAIGRQACMQGIRTRYIRLPDPLTLRDKAVLTRQGITKLLKKFSSYKMLILDEFLLNDLSDDEQHFLFELIERRHDCTSTIFCTQYKKEDWHARLGGGVHADAIMDRIVHNAVWIYSGNINMREYYAKHK